MENESTPLVFTKLIEAFGRSELWLTLLPRFLLLLCSHPCVLSLVLNHTTLIIDEIYHLKFQFYQPSNISPNILEHDPIIASVVRKPSSSFPKEIWSQNSILASQRYFAEYVLCTGGSPSTNTQRPRMDLNKKSLPRPKTTTAWKLILHRSNISKS